MTIKWKRVSTHNGTRVCHRAIDADGRIVAQINPEHTFSVFVPSEGKWLPTYPSVREAKLAIEKALAGKERA